jgi:hypothetical protein
MSQRPVARCLFLCEQMIIEEGTRNFSLINCFNHLLFPSFPRAPERFTAFAVLTDGFGEVSLEIVVSALDQLEEIYRRSLRGAFRDRLAEYWLTLRARGLIFPRAGAYQVVLLADGEVIGQTRLALTHRGGAT